MPFSVSWSTLIEEATDLPPDATLVTPLSHKRFCITDVQEPRIIIEFERSDESRPLQREQFETLYHRIDSEPDGFELDRLPPDADPYPAVWSLHPRFEVDENDGLIRITDGPTSTQVIDGGEPDAETATDRTEPDVSVYADALLLIDALERQDIDALEDCETDALVNLYTLLSDVQRGHSAYTAGPSVVSYSTNTTVPGMAAPHAGQAPSGLDRMLMGWGPPSKASDTEGGESPSTY